MYSEWNDESNKTYAVCDTQTGQVPCSNLYHFRLLNQLLSKDGALSEAYDNTELRRRGQCQPLPKLTLLESCRSRSLILVPSMPSNPAIWFPVRLAKNSRGYYSRYKSYASRSKESDTESPELVLHVVSAEVRSFFWELGQFGLGRKQITTASRFQLGENRVLQQFCLTAPLSEPQM